MLFCSAAVSCCQSATFQGKLYLTSQQGLPTSTCPLECLGWDLALHKPLLTILKVNYVIQTPVHALSSCAVGYNQKSLLAVWMNTTSKQIIALQDHIINHLQDILITVISLSFAINQDHGRF